MEEKVISEVEGKEVAEVSDEELAQLIAEGKKHQDSENSNDGVRADYILLAKTGTKALMKNQKDLYIAGLSIGDFFLQKEKKILGDKLKVVPLAFITLYQEKESRDMNSKFFGVWNKGQAESFPLVDGSYFDRQLPNGHILQPVNWVCVEVLGHPELENAVITYKSTGSRLWRKWKEDAKPRSQTSATLIYEISELDVSNDKNQWTDIGFNYVGSLLETDKVMAVKCLKKSNSIRESYENKTLVSDHIVASVSSTKAIAQIEDSYNVEESYDDEENGF